MKTVTPTKVVVSSLVLSALALGGCAAKRPGQPLRAIFAIDVSCRSEGQLLRYANSVYKAERRLPRGSSLAVYLFGRGCMPIYEGGLIESRDQFNRSIGPALGTPPPALTKDGMRAEAALETVTRGLEPPVPSVVVLLTDGGVEDQRPAVLRQIRHSVLELASNRALHQLLVIGVQPEFRRTWEWWLAPLGKRSKVRGNADGDEALQELVKEDGRE